MAFWCVAGSGETERVAGSVQNHVNRGLTARPASSTPAKLRSKFKGEPMPHRPSFGRGCTNRSYSKEVSPGLSTFRSVFRDTFSSRAISLIVLPLMKCSRRIRSDPPA